MPSVLLAAALASAALAAPVRGPAAPARTPAAAIRAAAAPRVEVAFVLDTTGSMGGLIEGAKRRIWSIARRIGEGSPRPDLRIAVVAYRDVGDAYVTRVHSFSGDMDEVYASLLALRAEGGGDTPEHVTAALRDAVQRLDWSPQAGLKLIFLVGDAPPHLEYQDGDYRPHVQEARRRGIVVQAIQCGDDAATAQVFQAIAAAGLGHYARIDADGGMPVQVTAVDGELARLNAELAATVVVAGEGEAAVRAQRLVIGRAAMAAPAAAEAAGYYADAERLSSHDLVDRPVAEQKAAIAKGNAPALQGQTEAGALRTLQAQKDRRAALRARIAVLLEERARLLAKEGRKDAFDEHVVTQLRAEAARHGIRY